MMLAFLMPKRLPTRLSGFEGSIDDSLITAPTNESSSAKSGSGLSSFSFIIPHFTLVFVMEAKLSKLFTNSPNIHSIVLDVQQWLTVFYNICFAAIYLRY